jgi:hypothetical protein
MIQMVHGSVGKHLLAKFASSILNIGMSYFNQFFYSWQMGPACKVSLRWHVTEKIVVPKIYIS